MNIIKNQKGSIALISTLAVSAILLILVLGVSDTQISTSYQQLNSMSGKYSYYISESCLEEAMGKLKTSLNYAGETINFEGEDTICVISITGNDLKTISITTTYGNYTQTWQGDISVTTSGQMNNIRLLNWRRT